MEAEALLVSLLIPVLPSLLLPDFLLVTVEHCARPGTGKPARLRSLALAEAAVLEQ